MANKKSAPASRGSAGAAPAGRQADVVSDFFARTGLKQTAQRAAIVRAFADVKEHVSIDSLLERVRETFPGVGYATVYRTLKLLKDAGFADERQFGDGKTLYEPMSEHHHDHLICTRCHTIQEFEDARIEALQLAVAKRFGFELTGHKMELYGLCSPCRALGAT